MKKTYLLIITILISNISWAQTWPYVGAAGQGIDPQNLIQTADVFAISDNDVYSAVFQTDIGGNNKSLKVYHFDGTTWQSHSTLSTDVVIGSIYFRKSRMGTIFLAYSQLGAQSNYFIYVKKLVNGSFVSVGDSLPLTSGIKYFGFDVDNNNNPFVLGSKSFILDPTRISKNVNGVWSHTQVPNASGATIEENNTLVDDNNNLIFMYGKALLVNGVLSNSIMVDTLLSNNTLSTGTESIVAKYPSFSNLLFDANNTLSILNRETIGNNAIVKIYKVTNGAWSNASTDTVNFTFSLQNAMSAKGKIIAASTDGKVALAPSFNSFIHQPSTAGTCYKLRCFAETGYAIYSTGIVRGELNSSIGINNTKQLNLIAFPNPSTKYVQLNTNQIIQSIKVYNIEGKLLLQNQDSQSINIEDLNTGLYLVEVQFKNGEMGRAKVLKQ